MENFFAVLVLYKTPLHKSKTFLSIQESLIKSGKILDLLVYDNTPSFNSGMASGVYGPYRIIYRGDNNNPGVSTAYNEASMIAKEYGKRWLWLLDQDTTFPENTIEKYLAAIELNCDEKLFCPIMISGNKIISPCYFILMRGFSKTRLNPGSNTFKNHSIINCGMCIDTDAFIKNGGYNAQIKLDFSDHEFIHRFKKQITKQFIIINLKVDHLLSSEEKNSLADDLQRFEYYLLGARYFDCSSLEKTLLIFNVLLRSLKLSLIHQNLNFIYKVLKWI